MEANMVRDGRARGYYAASSIAERYTLVLQALWRIGEVMSEQAPSKEKVPPGEIVYLPKITATMIDDWNHPVDLMRYHGGVQWTQDAVDFACLVAQHAYAEIERLQALLKLETGALEQACAAPVDAPLTVEQARAGHEPEVKP